MKYIIGIIATVVILCIAAYFMLNLWGIENPVSREHFIKALVTLGIIAVVSLLLTVLLPFFFKNHSKGYDKNGGNIAKSKQNKN